MKLLYIRFIRLYNIQIILKIIDKNLSLREIQIEII